MPDDRGPGHVLRLAERLSCGCERWEDGCGEAEWFLCAEHARSLPRPVTERRDVKIDR